VCKAKGDEGLGATNLPAFNASLLAKWQWRFLAEKDALWHGLLVHRYGCCWTSDLNNVRGRVN